MPQDNYYSESSEPAPIQSWVTGDTLQQIINRKNLIQDIIDILNGQVRDKEGNVIKNLGYDALMNNRGIHSVARILNSQLTQNTLLTNLKEHEVRKIVGIIGRHIIFDLSDHMEDYGIKDLSDLDSIWSIVIPNIMASLMSAREGFTFSKLSPEYKRIEHYAEKSKSIGMPLSFGGLGGRKDEE